MILFPFFPLPEVLKTVTVKDSLTQGGAVWGSLGREGQPGWDART